MASELLVFVGAAAATWALAGAWPAPVAIACALLSGLLVTVLARRFGASGRTGAALVATAPQALAFSLARTPGRWRTGLGVLLTALGARDRAPAFVRLRLRPASVRGAAAVTETLSGAPGLVVVDADAGSLLAHALIESDVAVPQLQALEQAALRRAGDPA